MSDDAVPANPNAEANPITRETALGLLDGLVANRQHGIDLIGQLRSHRGPLAAEAAELLGRMEQQLDQQREAENSALALIAVFNDPKAGREDVARWARTDLAKVAAVMTSQVHLLADVETWRKRALPETGSGGR